MISVNFVKPSAVVFDNAEDLRPCRNKCKDWAYRMRHNFTGEIYDVNVSCGTANLIAEIQCTYVDMNTPGALEEVRKDGYEDIIAAVNNSGTNIEKLCIIDNVVILPTASIGALSFAMEHLHCIVCQLLALGFGDHCYFGWVMNFRNMSPKTVEVVNFLMQEYKDGDIVQDYLLEGVPYFHRIPWNAEEEAKKWLYEGKSWEQMNSDERKECLAMARAGKCAAEALK